MNPSRPIISYRAFTAALQSLEIPRDAPVIVHASLSAFGRVRGGAETAVGALHGIFDKIMVPTFTYKTMIIPENGPANNGIKYGTGKSLNKLAQFYSLDMPADKLMGTIPEMIRTLPGARRSAHPILSFGGVGVESILASQTLRDPLAPIKALAQSGGWVLLLGVDQTSNTSLHYAEKLAGRRQFIRWALTQKGIRECPGFPGCSNGFQLLEPSFAEIMRTKKLGWGEIRGVPLPQMLKRAYFQIREKPKQYLCASIDCMRCGVQRGDGERTAPSQQKRLANK